MNVKFCLLGPLEVIFSGEPVKISGARQRKLLALLLINANRVVGIDQLVDALWPDPPRSVRQQVHNAVAGLRRTLADAAQEVRIVRSNAGYRLEVATESVDLHRFTDRTRAAHEAEARGDLAAAIELLGSALSLWRGPALNGLDGRAFETAAASLEESKLTTIEKLTGWRLRAGESASLTSELTWLVAQHPLRESLRGSLMQALHRSGRQADALAVYEEGRRRLADELGLDPGVALRNLHLAILNGAAADPSGTSAPAGSDSDDTSPAARSRPGRPRSFLPHDTIDFSGRTTELATLLDEVSGNEPTTLVISAIDGMGGVGKTTLAVRLSHQAAQSYPDGQYFVDLHGFSAGLDPLSTEQALEQLLRDSGVPPELVPAGTEARSALWRSQLAGTRSLVLLDNAIDATQVRPLLPGNAGVLVIVTSRRRLSALDGAVPMSLDVLSPSEAVDMFTKVVGERRAAAEPEAVQEAVRLCGHLPLAIRIAAARLRDRASWTVANLVDRIHDQAHRARFLEVEDRNVMAVLKVSHRYLKPLESRVFRLLSLHPGTRFDAYSAAALVGITVDEAESCLDALFDVNLLKQHSAEQFHFHDLVRDCARQLLDEVDSKQEHDQAVRRLLDYYLTATETWSRALSTGTPLSTLLEGLPQHEVRPVRNPADAAATLESEFPEIGAVARFAADHGWHEHAWKIVCAVEPYLRQISYSGMSYELYALAVAAANTAGDLLGEYLCLAGLGFMCREHGAKQEAVRHFSRALKLVRELDAPERESSLLIHLGVIHLDLELHQQAEQDFNAALELLRDQPNHPNLDVIRNNLAVVSRELGKFDIALDHLDHVLAHTLADDEAGFLLTKCNVALVLHAKRRHKEALREFEEVLSGCTTIDYRPGQAWASLGLCCAHRSLGDFTTSVEHGRTALTLGRQLKMPDLECEALNAIGEAAVAAGDLDHAEKVFAQAEERAIQYSFARRQARAKEGFAHIARARGDLATAERYWREAADLHPAGLHEGTHLQAHLAALTDQAATCFRCETL
ncbi:DNA-binding SARP family transcriptional activator [Lentzea atacamensis]|uniref:DNA-binding SARP family transcriptional activator n=1 Tax=Lentzea atacamensis TaxID=531938 RepID=A0A316HKH7_9PSEU|nr:BTAD domain-containing putative transcriptional regulator [Lentzea atacamensis]PWK80673.1 DNA-binding SARP family transcriptional activator [Lentzea atacamensis]